MTIASSLLNRQQEDSKPQSRYRHAEGTIEERTSIEGHSSVEERSSIDTVEQCVGRWWLVHTRARNEKALARDLSRLEVDYFLPLVKVPRSYGGRKTVVEIPLFPGYLFLNGDENARYATLLTHRAAQVIEVVAQERLQSDLRQIAMLVDSDEPLNVYPAIRRGRRCRVIRGTLRGLEGVVLRRRDVFRVYVAVDILGQSAEVEIDPANLEAID